MIINSTSQNFERGSKQDLLFRYNGLDCCITLEVFQKMKEELDQQSWNTYQFELSQIPLALQMTFRGVRINIEERGKQIVELEILQKKVDNQLNALAQARASRDLNPNSNKQLKEFFYDTLKLPIQYRYDAKRKERVPTCNREALEKLDDYWQARPFTRHILSSRKLGKTISTLQSSIDSDGRLRAAFNPSGTDTGRWCLSGEIEVLTKSGWQDLASWKGGLIACWKPTKEITWEECKVLEFAETDLLNIEGNRIAFSCTPEHKIPSYTSRGKFITTPASNMAQRNAVPLAGILKASFEDETKTRICVMIQADGSVINENLIRFHFKKSRKISRCLELLKDFEIKTTTTDSTYIYWHNPPIWAKQAKYFDSWLLNHNPTVFINELQHWDGNDENKTSIVYYTSIFKNAEWVKTMAHLAGSFASIRIKRVSDDKWATAYRVYIGSDATTRLSAKDYKSKSRGKAYCAETPTGFFIIRHKGKISITGNSSNENPFRSGTNLQNITPKLRKIFISDRNYKMGNGDLEQSESRFVGAYAFQLTGISNYLDACEGGDLHTLVAQKLWPHIQNREDAEQPFYLHFSFRDMAKRGSHGSNYYGTARTMAMHLKLPTKVLEEFQEQYFAAFPEIQKWHQAVATELQSEFSLTTLFGRRRNFWGRATDTDTLRQAIAFLPQSASADYLDAAALRISADPDLKMVQLLLQGHDALTFQFPETAEEPAILQKIKAHVEQPFYVRDRAIKIPFDIAVGWNWGKYHKDNNPDGLAKPSLQRTRTFIPDENPNRLFGVPRRAKSMESLGSFQLHRRSA
mgnify:CR=1 FL=1